MSTLRPLHQDRGDLAVSLAEVPKPHPSWFSLPPEYEASGPVEVLGKSRDEVRLEVASATGIVHTVFKRLDEFLEAGDVLVANDSATLPAAIDGALGDRQIRLHVSTPVQGTRNRLVELRTPEGFTSRQLTAGNSGDTIKLAGGGRATLLAPRSKDGTPRLWEANLELPQLLVPYLQRWGQPIRYAYTAYPWPLRYYQTILAKVPGSSEMPSAARPFSKRLLRRIALKGIELTTITLHTGVASLEVGEPPYPEPYEISPETARIINTAKSRGGRVIAVGTTAIRALETACAPDGSITAGGGFTDLIITPERPIRAIDGLITGWHEPEASHLMILEAVAGYELVAASYAAALENSYLWHEFGDSHLIMR